MLFNVTLFLYHSLSLLFIDNHVIVKVLQVIAMIIEVRKRWIRASKEIRLLDLMLETGDFDE